MNVQFKIIALAVLITSVLSLTSCRRAQYAENQAYAVMLGIDITDEDKIEVTVKYPKLSGGTGGSSGGASGESSSYVVSGSEGESFQEALDKLRTIMPG